MVAKLIMKVGAFSITQDEVGGFHLLNQEARTVGASRNLESMENLARLLSTETINEPGFCSCQACKDGRLLARLSDALSASKREVQEWKDKEMAAYRKGFQEGMKAQELSGLSDGSDQ